MSVGLYDLSETRAKACKKEMFAFAFIRRNVNDPLENPWGSLVMVSAFFYLL